MTFTPPDFSAGPNETIRRLEGAIIVPPPAENRNQSIVVSAVVDAAGETVPESLTWRGRSLVSRVPFAFDPARVRDLPGRYLFAGVLFGHFGHFLVESTCRLWALDRLEDEIDGIIYTPKVQTNAGHVAKIYQDYLRLLGCTLPLIPAETPLRAEVLHVPQQGFGMFEMIGGTAAYRNFMRARAARDIRPEGPEKIYISRAALPPQRGGVIGESHLQALLAGEGFEPFHPQQHSFGEQFARYKAARFIVALDGSPLHMAALVADPATQVAVIARRPGIAEAFEVQFRDFAGIAASIHSCLTGNWIPETDSRASRVSFGELDLPLLQKGLRAAGMLGPGPDWAALTEAEVSGYLKAVEAKQGVSFKFLKG
jgi:hypothetical protein